MKKKGFNDANLLKLAVAINARYEVVYSDSDFAQSELLSYDSDFLWLVTDFIYGMWESLRDDLVGLSKDDESQLTIWVEVFRMHCILKRLVMRNIKFFNVFSFLPLLCAYLLCSHIGRAMSPRAAQACYRTWREECFRQLPNPAHAQMRERLLRLEEVHGGAIRNRFPQEYPTGAEK